MRSTNEQMEIIYSGDNEIFVPALAGTGKTKTLTEYTKLHRRDKILCLFYNSSMKLSALNRFPERVDIFTYHGLAKQSFKDYKVSDIDLEEISKICKITIKESFQVNKLLTEFFNSDLELLNEINSPLVKYAEIVWIKMKNKELDITHDGYLKLYQLSKPDLSSYDIIMIDEAQDLSAVMYDIVKDQSSVKIYVGDINQQIYGFRGSINIFNNIDTKYKLTQSFRFGKKIADVANVVLKENSSSELLKGSPEVDSEILFDSSMEDVQKTHIFRTNTELFKKAVEYINQGREIYIIGAETIFERLLNALNLYEGKDIINDKYMQTFDSFRTFKGVSTVVSELKFMVKIVESFGPSLRDYIYKLKKMSKKNAEHIFVTAHKAKGLEFLYVKIENDFMKIDIASREELNLLYVAITRASYYLELNEDLKKYI